MFLEPKMMGGTSESRKQRRAVADTYPDAFKLGKSKELEYHLVEDFNLDWTAISHVCCPPFAY